MISWFTEIPSNKLYVLIWLFIYLYICWEIRNYIERFCTFVDNLLTTISVWASWLPCPRACLASRQVLDNKIVCSKSGWWIYGPWWISVILRSYRWYSPLSKRASALTFQARVGAGSGRGRGGVGRVEELKLLGAAELCDETWSRRKGCQPALIKKVHPMTIKKFQRRRCPRKKSLCVNAPT